MKKGIFKLLQYLFAPFHLAFTKPPPLNSSSERLTLEDWNYQATTARAWQPPAPPSRLK